MIGLDKITGRILENATAYRDNAYQAAEHDIAELEDSYKSKAAFIRAEARNRAEKEAESIRLRADSSIEIDRRNRIMEAKSGLVDRAYEMAADKIRHLPRDRYLAFLVNLLVGSVRENMESETKYAEYYSTGELTAVTDYSVLLNPEDQAALGKELVASSGKMLAGTGKKLSLSAETVSTAGGFVLRCGDVEINCTLEPLLSAVRGETEGQIYRVLFSE